MRAPLTRTLGVPVDHWPMRLAGVVAQRHENVPASGRDMVATSPANVFGSVTPGAGVNWSGR